MPHEDIHPPAGDPLALVLARLATAFTAVSALADSVDALPCDQAHQLRPSTSAALGALTEAEDTATRMAVER